MKKIIPFCLVILVIAISLSSLSGCVIKTLTEDEAKQLLMDAIQNSLNDEVYYWKELNNRGEEPISIRFNNYKALDKNGNIIMQDGKPKNEGLRYEKSVGNKYTEQYCGLSKGSDGNYESYFLSRYEEKDSFGTVIISEKQKEIQTIQQFMEREENSLITLQSKLFDISLLTKEDIVFDSKKGGFMSQNYDVRKQQVKLVKLGFKVSEDFFNRYEQQYGKPSILKGVGMTVELAYDHISIITVYDKVSLDQSYIAESEVYRLDIVRIGPIVKIPSYSDWK